jgi:hypothetical protein
LPSELKMAALSTWPVPTRLHGGGLVIDFVVPSAVEAKLVGLPLVNISYIGQSKYVHLENVHHLRSYLAKT